MKGWLDNYGEEENYNNSKTTAPEGFQGDGFSNVGRNYSPAWGGQFQKGGKLKFLQPTDKNLPKGYRIPYDTSSSERAMSIGGENEEPAYLIPSFKYGQPLDDPLGEFRKTGEHLGGPFKTWQEADEWERTVRHPAVEKGENIMFPQQEFRTGGEIPKAQSGFRQINDNIAVQAAKIFDPTGVSSWPDVYYAIDDYNKGTGSGLNVGLNVLGALPVLGKLGKGAGMFAKSEKLAKITNKLSKVNNVVDKVENIVPNAAKMIGDASDVIARGSRAGKANPIAVATKVVGTVGKGVAKADKATRKATAKVLEKIPGTQGDVGNVIDAVSSMLNIGNTTSDIKSVVDASNRSTVSTTNEKPINKPIQYYNTNPKHGEVEKPGESPNVKYVPISNSQELKQWKKQKTKPLDLPEPAGPVTFPLPSPSAPEEFAMGGSIPGAVGFTYARTKGIPSNGPYAKKTLASAQNGVDMYENPMLARRVDNPNVNRSYYDPRLNTMNIGTDYTTWKDEYTGELLTGDDLKYHQDKLLAHENYHAIQHSQDRDNYDIAHDTDNAQWAQMQKRPEVMSTHAVWNNFYNRSDFENQQDYQEMINSYPESRILNQNLLFDKVLDRQRYDNPANLEGEAKFYEDTGVDISKQQSEISLNPARFQNGGEMRYYQHGLDWKPKGMENGGWLDSFAEGGIIKDDMGQWAHPGEITEIGSNNITMQGVPYDVLGISDEGDIKLMKPGKNYKFKGKKVTEFPMAKNGVNQQDQKTFEQLDQLTNFTNYNKPQPGGWLNKYN